MSDLTKMKLVKKILETEMANRESAIKANPADKKHIAPELDELHLAYVKLFIVDSTSSSFDQYYNTGFKDGLEHRTLKCKCGKN